MSARTNRRPLLLSLSLAAALAGAPLAAAAKDLCVQDSDGGSLKFRKVASLKKPGSMVALHGLLVLPASPERPELAGAEGPIDGGEGGEGEGVRTAPVVGTAVTLPDGSVKVGVHELGEGVPDGLSTATASLVTDVELNGSGAIDFDGDTVQDAPYAWTAIDCDTFDALVGF
jgi:hypothetical protein